MGPGDSMVPVMSRADKEDCLMCQDGGSGLGCGKVAGERNGVVSERVPAGSGVEEGRSGGGPGKRRGGRGAWEWGGPGAGAGWERG